MRLSCKISNSVLNYLESQGEDFAVLFENTEIASEFLRDTNCWMQASELENFLEQSVRMFSGLEGNLIERIARGVPEQRSWGILDSVLRMMPRPQEIFVQPERFLSYFISPPPPVMNISRNTTCVEFEVPISSEQYPRTIEFLRHSFEALPLFIGQSGAQCSWQGTRVKVSWETEQKSMFQEEVGHQISPELLRSVVESLESTQRELQARTLELQNAKATKPAITEVSSPANEVEISLLRNNFSRISDYMVRAQQLITLLVAQDRMNAGVKEAMRRTNWENVVQQFPQTVQESQSLLAALSKNNSAPKNQYHKPTQEPLNV